MPANGKQELRISGHRKNWQRVRKNREFGEQEMRRIATAMVILAAVLTGIPATASETKVGGRLYADWHLDVSDKGDDANSFNLTRTYIDIKSKISEFTSVRFTLDMRQTTGFDGNNIVLKYGFLDWKPAFTKKHATLRFGLHPIPYVDYMNKLWGRRYLVKTTGDKNKYLTTSDLGASVVIPLGTKSKWGSSQISVFNGTAYTDVTEQNKQKDINVFTRFSPLANSPDFSHTQILGQFYTGTQNMVIDSTMNSSDYDRTLISVGGRLVYRKTFTIAGDFNFLSTGQGMATPDRDQTAHSVFATLLFDDLVEGDGWFSKVNVFGRLDFVDPDTDVNNNSNTLFIAGVEYAPVKGFKGSINFRNTSYDDSTKDSKQYVYVNWLVKI